MGYVVYATFFNLCGFQTKFFGLGVALGWNTHDELVTTFIISGFLLIAFLVL